MQVEREFVSAPSVAEIVRLEAQRPAWLRDEPIAVDERLFDAAKRELETLLGERGWPLSQDEALSRRGIENFLLWGKPVVIAA